MSNQKSTSPTTEHYKGRVIVSHRSEAIVESTDNNTFLCKSKKGIGRTICGDNVTFHPINENEGIIQSIQARSSTLTRPDSRGKLKSIAANIDQLIIVSAIVPEINFELIDRYIVAARMLKISPVILLNKIDLVDDTDSYDDEMDVYIKLGIKVIYTSIKAEDGMKSLRNALNKNISILVGQSGVGKSSLIKQLIPDLDIRIGEISSYHLEGKHTTTSTNLYHLDCGGDIIDSPGVRNFRLWNLSPHEIQSGFDEIVESSHKCKFNNCLHKKEPGCNVREDIRGGNITQRRLDSFHAIIQSLELKY
ncbi:MAG: ribosome small subunit-dependent GTPase A [Gammaproteobacteria bacterium]|nr:MAG: ribosome small subunit-dependent GTPase A [Gammaproteobacteria bacterium]